MAGCENDGASSARSRSDGSIGNSDWCGKGDDHLVIPVVAATATFNAGSAGERQINVEGTGRSVNLTRDDADRDRVHRVMQRQRLVNVASGNVVADSPAICSRGAGDIRQIVGFAIAGDRKSVVE